MVKILTLQVRLTKNQFLKLKTDSEIDGFTNLSNYVRYRLEL